VDNKLKHLEFIQKVIDRQARNSFLLKGWVITLVAAGLALKEVNYLTELLVYLIVVFWVLDSYYLWQERLFRSLYNEVRKKSITKIDFNMSTGNLTDECKFLDVLSSRTLLIFYISLMIFVLCFLKEVI
jgi:hypothetical protein